jgi:hypothetical protein
LEILIARISALGSTAMTNVKKLSLVEDLGVWILLFLCCLVIAHVSAVDATEYTAPVYAYYDGVYCEGTPSTSPYFASPTISQPGACYSDPVSHTSLMYQCDQANLTIHKYYEPNCKGSATEKKIAVSQCLMRQAGESEYSTAILCDLKQSMRPATQKMPVLGSGFVFYPTPNCTAPFQCKPGVPFMTRWNSPFCSGPAAYSSEIYHNAYAGYCYLYTYSNLNMEMSCNNHANDQESFVEVDWYSSGCSSKTWISSDSLPMNTCITSMETQTSTMYLCGSKFSMNGKSGLPFREDRLRHVFAHSKTSNLPSINDPESFPHFVHSPKP